MSERNRLSTFLRQALFVCLASILLFANLLPLQTVPRGWAGPDLLFCLAMVWSIRRPDYVPLSVLAILFLLSDFLLGRPPGLLAALMLIACFDLQSRRHRLTNSGFATEWARVAGLIIIVAVSYRIVLAVLIVPLPSFSLTVFQVVVTILAYPLTIFVSSLFFGIRTTGPGDIEGVGQNS